MKDSFAREGKRVCEGVVDTQQLGEELGAALEAGDLVILDGPLGAGKTTFTQGIARGMQVKGRVTSPTFVIARQHASTVGGPALVHVDASVSATIRWVSSMRSTWIPSWKMPWLSRSGVGASWSSWVRATFSCSWIGRLSQRLRGG